MKARLIKSAIALLSILVVLVYFGFIMPFWGVPFNKQRHGNPPLTPEWALECWLWEDDVNTAAYVDELLDGYKKYDIPVRTIIIDSPWSYKYNDFNVDTTIYPNYQRWFLGLEEKGYRVVLWMTSMVNSYNKDLKLKDTPAFYDFALNNGYLAGDHDITNWWKGKGGFIDYTNEEAMNWWQGMQSTVLDLGIDGWKLDGTATYFANMDGYIPILYLPTLEGLLTTRQYMDLYYRKEYEHGLSKNPDFITLSRSVDRWYHPEGFAPIDAAPVTWVGDQEHIWGAAALDALSEPTEQDLAMKGKQGFSEAIKSILKSADLGYNIIGSDIAGFSGKTIPPELYIRWAQFSTFCGLFMNGGHGERRLWNRSNEELEIIRKFSWLHTELKPYMYHYVVTGHQGNGLLQKPISGKYQYMFGDYLLISPIYKGDLNKTVELPDGQWRYWFRDKETIEGPAEINQTIPMDEYPVFIKEGAIIPMHIERSYTGFGSEDDEGYLTFLIYPGLAQNTFEVYRQHEESTTLSYAWGNEVLQITMTGKARAHVLRIHSSKRPGKVSFEGKELVEGLDYQYLTKSHKIRVKAIEQNSGTYSIEF